MTLFLLSVKTTATTFFPISALVWLCQLLVGDNIITVWYYSGNFGKPQLLEIIQYIILFVQLILQNRESNLNLSIVAILFFFSIFSHRTLIGFIPHYRVVKVMQTVRTLIVLALMIILPFHQLVMSNFNLKTNAACGQNFDRIYESVSNDIVGYLQQPKWSTFDNRTRLTWSNTNTDMENSVRYINY